MVYNDFLKIAVHKFLIGLNPNDSKHSKKITVARFNTGCWTIAFMNDSSTRKPNSVGRECFKLGTYI